MGAVTEIRWRWSNPKDGYGLLLPGIFEKWHRAKMLGLRLEEVTFDREPLSPRALEKLNYFVEADGAWRSSLLDHFESERVLAAVIRRHVTIHLGAAGAGRWAAGTPAEILLRDSCERI